eukprot:2966145-Amphidinium_carterae.1
MKSGVLLIEVLLTAIVGRFLFWAALSVAHQAFSSAIVVTTASLVQAAIGVVKVGQWNGQASRADLDCFRVVQSSIVGQAPGETCAFQ